MVGVTEADAGMLPSYDFLLEDESVIPVGRLKLHTILTPGHTPGSMCFKVEGSPVLFSGDTLFPGGPGATTLGLLRLRRHHPLDRRPPLRHPPARHPRPPRPRRRHHHRHRAPPPPGVGRPGLVKTIEPVTVLGARATKSVTSSQRRGQAVRGSLGLPTTSMPGGRPSILVPARSTSMVMRWPARGMLAMRRRPIHSGQLGVDPHLVVGDPRVEAQQRAQEQQRRRRRPRLGLARRRVAHREGHVVAAEAAEQLGQAVVEVGGRVEQALDDPVGLVHEPVAHEAGGDDGVVVGPDRADVVADRVVARSSSWPGCGCPSR